MKVVMFSTDQKLFDPDSAVRRRILEYGNLFEELHLIVLSLRSAGLRRQKVYENVWLHPTDSWFRLLTPFDAVWVGFQLKRHFERNRQIGGNDRIVISSQDPFETGLAGWLLSKLLRAKLQLQIHTDFLSSYFCQGHFLNRLRVWLAGFLLPKADGIRVVSERIKQSLLCTSGFRLQASGITVLPIFVDAKRILDWKPVSDIRDKLPAARFRMLAISRLTPEKNIGLALETLSEVVKKYPLTGLVIIGEGPERPWLMLRARDLGVDRNVVFLPWTTDVLSAMKTANLFLMTSFYEGYGMTLIEAGLSGLPIVTSDVGAARDLFQDSDHVLICPVGDKNCFTRSVIRLIEDNELRENLRSRSRGHLEHILPSKKKYLANFKRSFELCFEANLT